MPFTTVSRPVSGFAAWSAKQAGTQVKMRQVRTMYEHIRGGAIDVTPEFFNALEDYIRWTEHVPREAPRAMDLLCRFMALTNLGIAQSMSAGPRDPRGERPQFAWRIPVRRISQRYFYGWKVKRIRVGAWMLYNDSREAFFIEFGIHRDPRTGLVSGRRVRRPIRKLSLKRTLEAMMRTKVYHRIWAEIYVDKRTKRHAGFTQIVQSPRMGTFGGPSLGRNLPG